SCQTYDAARGYLAEQREAMAGQTSCTANSADLVTSWLRDSALRVTKLTRPDGSCLHYEYDTKGRLSKTKRRDDCNAASSGDREEYTYSADSLLTKVERFDAAGTVTHRREMTYFDSRRLEKLINPADTSKWTGLIYDSFGLVSEVNGGGNLSKTTYTRDIDGRVQTESRYRTSSAYDSWSLLYDWIGNQKQVTDGNSKITKSVRDDRGFTVRLESPDLGGYPTVRVYDEANRLSAYKERVGGTGSQTHSYYYDQVRRTTAIDYQGYCAGSAALPEIEYTYDAMPSGITCPITGGCNRILGRLAYVKVTLMCSTAYTDKTLDQETFYSYDDAGRIIREYIRDDTGRTAEHQFTWTKNGALAQTTTPSGAVLGATFGSTGSNSDTDRISALWRTSTSTPVIDNVLWNPYGPLQQYNQLNTAGGTALRTKISRNLAYRITNLEVEKQSDGTDVHRVAISEDAKGRVITRDYSAAATGVEDSYFLYDYQDRVLCETTSLVTSCPADSLAINVKNAHSAFSPPFTAAGDWKGVYRTGAGTSCLDNHFSLTSGTHQISSVSQPGNGGFCYPELEYTTIGHDGRGNRSYEDNTVTLTYDRRDYTYDARRNVTNVRGRYKASGLWETYDVTSAFDARNRRVFKSFTNVRTLAQAQWFFYYDANDRLVEVRHTPDTASSSTYSVFQLFWLQNRLVSYWQTDYPSATTSKRYVGTDESERPIDMWSWPSTGDGARVWAINPRAWGMDGNAIGPTLFQPILFAGQYQDTETMAPLNDGTTIHRPGLALNGFRTYDPFTGSYLQVDPLLDSTWSTYVYANGNPITGSDPSGLAARDDGWCWVRSCWANGYCEDWEVNPNAPDTCWSDDGAPTGGGGMGGGGGGGGPSGPDPNGPPPTTSECNPWDIWCVVEEALAPQLQSGPWMGVQCTLALLVKEELECKQCERRCWTSDEDGKMDCILNGCFGENNPNEIVACRQCDRCTIPGTTNPRCPQNRKYGMTSILEH
ncbi:MAG: RHS repeat-associated core domain-containing protein, partial [Myxococcota bacterium]|nr:RHS repeat-associated core domain-containing protein [Myxococcota bacterium]